MNPKPQKPILITLQIPFNSADEKDAFTRQKFKKVNFDTFLWNFARKKIHGISVLCHHVW